MLLGETDTTVAVDALFHRGLRQKSGVERLRMACDMFDVATALIVASLRPEVAGDRTERRIAVLQRRYWPERNEPLIKSTTAALRLGSERRERQASPGRASKRSSASAGVVVRHAEPLAGSKYTEAKEIGTKNVAR